MTESTDLVLVESFTPAVIFREGGSDDILADLRKRVLAVHRDISTEKGRKAIKSLRFKVARSKTLLDEAGKALGADLDRQKKAIDAERRKIRDACDALGEEISAELEVWEVAEEKRLADHNAAIEAIFSFAVPTTFPNPSAYYRDQLEKLDAFLASPRDWQEFVHKAKDAADVARQTLIDNLVAAEAREAAEKEAARVAAELEAERLAELARQQAEREARIAQEAAEEATRLAQEEALRQAAAAEEAAKRERDRIEMARLAAIKRAEEAEREREKQRVDSHKRAISSVRAMVADACSPFNNSDMIKHIVSLLDQMPELTRDYEEFQPEFDAALADGRKQIAESLFKQQAAEEARRLQVEREREAAIETARLAAERQKEREIQQALDAERERVERARRLEREEEGRKAKDKAHRAKVNGEVKEDLLAHGMTEQAAVSLITAVVKGQIRNLAVEY